MALRMWGQVIIQTTIPAEAPVMVGTLWADTATGVLKQCTSISPYTFTTIGGSGSGGDVDGPASAVDGRVAVFDGATGKLIKDGGLVLPASEIVGRTDTQTLTNKTLTAPVIATIGNGGTLTLPTSTDTLVGKATTDVLTNKTLTSPVIATIVNGAGTLTLPSSTDTLVGKATTDTLTNKTLTSPVLTTPTADQITTPLVIGGTGVASPLALRSTSGVGTTGADIVFQTGSNGGTEAARLTNSGNLGLGIATLVTGLLSRLHVLVTATSGIILTMDAIKANANAPLMLFRSARGTPASPSKTLSGDGIGRFAARGWQDTSGAFTTANNASIGFTATEDFTSTAQGTEISVQVTPTGSVTPATQMVINPTAWTVGSMVTPATTGQRYLVIDTAGKITSSVTAPIGT